MNKKLKLITFAIALLSLSGFGQSLLNRPSRTNRQEPSPATPPASAADEKSASGGRSIEFNGAPIDMVFTVYQDLVGKTVLKDPQTPAATITLQPRKGQELTNEDKIEAIETVLEMNGIHMEPYGEKFVRALPRKDVRKDGIPLIMDPEAVLGESTRVVSLMIPFKNIGVEEAQKALEGFKSNSGILLVFERTNSILVTDTEQIINRMREIAKTIDIASPVSEVVEYIQIKYANANEIKQVIDSIVQESMKEQEKSGNRPQNNAAQPALLAAPRTSLLGRRPGQSNQPTAPANNASLVMTVSDADRGMIRGKVVTIADERSNKILIITNKSNMDFFKKVIDALDVETTPDTVVKVYRLKYAESEDVSDMINDLIGNSSSSKSSGKNNQNQNAKRGTSGSVSRNTQAAKKPANQRSGDPKAGELSKDNTTVLADKRINGLVVMTQKELVPTIEQIIESMDIKLSQVLIETVIIEVGLGDGIETGIDWVHGLQAKNGAYQQALGGGGGSRNPVSQISSTNAAALIDGAETALPSIFIPGSAGLSYAVFSEKLNLSAFISASKVDSRSKYIASPIIMTLDNKEAVINATAMHYLLKGFTSSGNSYSTIAVPDYEQKELGIEIKVTPKINPNGTVMLTVEEKYTQLGAKEEIQYSSSNGTGGMSGLQSVAVPTTVTREMSSDVILENMQTVVFGGLTETSTTESESGIPILKDIPYVGKWLFGSVSMSERRTELLIFMTPYVLNDSEAAQAEALRRKKTLSDARPWDDHGWSSSELADPVSKKEQLRRIKDEWKKQDEERSNRMAIEEAKVERAKKLKEMSAEERAKWLLLHKEELEKEQQEALEEKMLDEKSQEGLKKLAEEIREKELSKAEKEIKEASEKK